MPHAPVVAAEEIQAGHAEAQCEGVQYLSEELETLAGLRSSWRALCKASVQHFKLEQGVQDHLARVVCNSNRSTSAGPLLRSLHWLPVRQRINFKLAKLC